jgi:glycosyltransferase involved in cell wall biosynthesis
MIASGRVSIITPFKNTASFIAECIHSVVSQEYTNWEMWLVDDYSTDESLHIVEKFAKVDKRIHILKNKSRGIIPALQLAYSHCTGEYITRMDSDDVMFPNRLNFMVQALVQAGAGNVSVGLVKYFNVDGVSDGYRKYEEWINGLTREGRNFEEIYKECVIPSPCFMIYRIDFEDIGGFDGDIYPEDYDLTFRMYKGGLKVLPCDTFLHYWRDYSYRTSRTQENYSQMRLLDIRLYYFLKLDYDKSRPLLVWGASVKGKRVAKTLNELNIPFEWICDNDKKIDQIIYGQRLQSYQIIDNYKVFQSIIVVANPLAQVEITNYLKSRKLESKKDYFFFC